MGSALDTLLETSWKSIIASELEKSYFKVLNETIDDAYLKETVFPSRSLIFHALQLCPIESTRVVILGQDPYHGAGQAHGLSFSVPEGVKIPPSLRNIYKELAADVGKPIPTSGNLERWATQGVLLLNATLTVESGRPGSHQDVGWEMFTDTIIKGVSDTREHVVFLLWGNYARAKKSLIDYTKHLVLEAPHPSPLSARTGFFGCKHFSKTNRYLEAHRVKAIDW